MALILTILFITFVVTLCLYAELLDIKHLVNHLESKLRVTEESVKSLDKSCERHVVVELDGEDLEEVPDAIFEMEVGNTIDFYGKSSTLVKKTLVVRDDEDYYIEYRLTSDVASNG